MDDTSCENGDRVDAPPSTPGPKLTGTPVTVVSAPPGFEAASSWVASENVARVLVRINADKTVYVAPDLTMDEAEFAIREMTNIVNQLAERLKQ